MLLLISSLVQISSNKYIQRYWYSKGNVMTQKKHFVELVRELEQMPEFELFYQDLLGLDISIFTFNRNFIDLDIIIKFANEDPRASIVFAQENRLAFQQYSYEVICRIHNFVAGAMSLVDHTRNLYEKLYPPKNLFPDYEERKKKDFIDDPLSQFIKGLRQVR